MGNFEKKEKYQFIMEELKRALNNNAWDGRWYKRAFTDDGDALGSLQNEECKIDSISQSWATISGAGNNDKKYIAMESLENHLVDKEIGINSFNTAYMKKPSHTLSPLPFAPTLLIPSFQSPVPILGRPCSPKFPIPV